ncbi:hypothetical protein CPB83DRAFT_896172 [Crepidotus variabilis]|uniref:Uncharacterized protein n=1 Tax=Crepidotus variabilis TaxID=179855 RepID=A0A9P6JMI2_9AGAR|nr:hypothetical protein CPB83DRAFT_896172 [Crepidotus variabilis]
MPSPHNKSFSSYSQVVGTSSLYSLNPPTHQHLASSVDGRHGLDVYYASSSLISPASSLHPSGYLASVPPTPATPFLSSIPLPVLASPQPRHLLRHVADTWESRLEGSSTPIRTSPLQPDIFSILRNFSSPQSSARSSPALLNNSPAILSTNGVGVKFLDNRAAVALAVDVGMGGTLSWAAAKPNVAHFFTLHNGANALEINWRPSPLDGCNELGYSFLQKFFRYLNQEERLHEMFSLPPASMLFSPQTTQPVRAGPISTFEQISIAVPSDVEIGAVEILEGAKRSSKTPVCIDLHHASRLQGLAWDGDFSFLVDNLEHIPLSQLIKLSISGCHMSVNDILSLMDQCPNLIEGAFGTIGDIEGTGKQDLLKPRELPHTVLPNLVRLELTINTSLVPVFKQLKCAGLASLNLNIYRGGHDLLRALEILSTDNLDSLCIKANLTNASETKLRASYPMAEIYSYHS